MNVGIIIFSRYNSSRLPGKALKNISSKPILAYVYERMLEVFDRDKIVLATSNEKTDNAIESYCQRNDINCFRGDLNNVAKRLIDCSTYYNFDYVIRITGDSIFIDQNIIIKMLDILKENKYEYITNRVPKTFPVGMSVDILDMEFYKSIYVKFTKDSHREHVVTYLLENLNAIKYKNFVNVICENSKDINFAIDTVDDFKTSQRIIKQFNKNHTKYGLNDIYKLYINE